MTNFLIKLFVKDSESIHLEKTRNSYGNLCGFAGIICNISLFLIKLFTGIVTGSIAIIADAINNLLDMVSSILTLFGFKLSSKPADKEHPFGHGRMEYMSGFLVSVIIAVVGIELFKSSFQRIFNPDTLNKLTFVVAALLVISILIKLWLYFFNKKIGKKINSGVLIATSKDCFYDALTTTVVLFSNIIYRIFDINIDAYTGLAVSLFIIYGGITSAIQTFSPLLGEPPSKDVVEIIFKTISEFDDFLDVHDFVMHNYGPGKMFASAHVEVSDKLDIISCHESVDACERKIYNLTGVNMVIHMDPVATDNDKYNSIKDKILNILKSISDDLSVHDFRIVELDNKKDLIFDVVKPFNVDISNEELILETKRKIQEFDNDYDCVITVDNV